MVGQGFVKTYHSSIYCNMADTTDVSGNYIKLLFSLLTLLSLTTAYESDLFLYVGTTL